MNQQELKIVFFGTPAFAAYSLTKMIEAGYNVVVVVTSADKPAGRGQKLRESEVKKEALKFGIPILQPSNLKDPDFQNTLRSYQADLGVVIAFRMMPEKVWSMPRLGTFNLHASLLPDYRGAAPINHAIIHGETKTGVTTFFLKHEIDTGDIVLQKEVAIEEADDAGILHDKLMRVGAELVLKTLQMVVQENLTTTPQPHASVLKTAPKLNRDFCKIQPDMPSELVHNQIRGLSPYPGAWIDSDYGTLKIFRVIDTGEKPSARGIYTEGKNLFLGCADSALRILEVQPEGKPRMEGLAFVNGLVNR